MLRVSAWSLGSSCVLLGAALAFGGGCSAGKGNTGGDDGQGGDPSHAGGAGGTGSGFQTGGGDAGGGAPVDDCIDNAKLIYVLSVDYELFSFDPDTPGTAAYKSVGPLNCDSFGAPQSMAVDRSGTAWVFYDSGELFKVSTLDASCQPTNYQHPNPQAFNQLGMGFTAAAANSKEEVLYIVSPIFGLATVDTSTMVVSMKNTLAQAAELTGGPDAKLFRFAADNAELDEIVIGNFSTNWLHTFNELSGTGAWAFSRYAGKFYLFTSPDGVTPSRTTVFDPVTNQSSVRDANVGFPIVGAGQSTCVPPPPPS
ncbi:MAG: hypothetical protein U0271_32065 [Polyangiaceae bacterium]